MVIPVLVLVIRGWTLGLDGVDWEARGIEIVSIEKFVVEVQDGQMFEFEKDESIGSIGLENGDEDKVDVDSS